MNFDEARLIGIGIILLVGIILFAIYAVGLKYTYAGAHNAPGQNVQGPSSGYRDTPAMGPADFYSQRSAAGAGSGDFMAQQRELDRNNRG